MTFIESVEEYLLQLRSENVLIEASPTSLSEIYNSCIVKALMLIDNVVEEKYIVVYKVNDSFIWSFFKMGENNVIYNNNSNVWHYPIFTKRIIAPLQLILQYSAFETWFRVNALPIVKVDQTLYCYCNEILPEHQALVDQLQGVITIETNVSN